MPRNRYKQFPNQQSKPTNSPDSAIAPQASKENSTSSASSSGSIVSNSQEKYKLLPDQMSLNAYQHIQEYLNGKPSLSKEEVNAVLRLSQHLRVFGLLSAVGYLNQAREGKVQERTEPVWKSLLGQLTDSSNPPDKKQLMESVQDLARKDPSKYMALWRKALALAKHWNFWAKAYQQGE